MSGVVFEEVPEEARVAVSYLLRVKEKLGIPDDAVLETDNRIILTYAFQIYKVWAALYPEEHRDFINAAEFDLKYERPIKDAVKAGGYSPIAIP